MSGLDLSGGFETHQMGTPYPASLFESSESKSSLSESDMEEEEEEEEEERQRNEK